VTDEYFGPILAEAARARRGLPPARLRHHALQSSSAGAAAVLSSIKFTLLDSVRFQKQLPERAQVNSACGNLALQFLDASVNSRRRGVLFHLERNQFAENVKEGFGFTLRCPLEITHQAVFAVLDAFLRQVLTGNAREITDRLGGEQPRILENALSFVVAALSPPGAALPTFFELTAFLSQAIASHFHYLNGRGEFCFKPGRQILYPRNDPYRGGSGRGLGQL